MKKSIFLFIAIALSISMHAQINIGGGFILSTQNSETRAEGTTNEGPSIIRLTVLPNVEYMLDENLSVGGKVGFDFSRSSYENGDGDYKVSLFMVHFSPFARMYFPAGDKVSLFGEGGFDFATGTEKYKFDNTTEDGDTQTEFSLGVKPGLSYQLAEKLALEFTTGFIGYQMNSTKNNEDPETTTTYNNVGINVNLSTISFGVRYSL